MLLAASGPAHAALCTLQAAASVPLRVVEGFPIVTASIGGTPVSMLLDTGAQGHLLLPEATAALAAAARSPACRRRMIGTGGAREAPDGDAARACGSAASHSRRRRRRSPTLPLVPQMTPLLAGLLGAPLLEAVRPRPRRAGGAARPLRRRRLRRGGAGTRGPA